MKTAFVCDSALQINKNFANNNPITVIPVEVRLDNEIFEDNVTITPDEFYERIHNGQKPSTSQPAVGKILSVYEELKRQGFERIVAFSVSSKLSGTYSSFVQAKELIDGIEIKIIDTLQIARMVGIAIEKIIKEFEEGSLTFENIEKRYTELSQQHNVLVTVETMQYLYAGGRLTKAQFVLSNLLNILPIITIKDGLLSVSGKHRRMNKVLSKMCEEIKEKNPKSLFVLYTNDELLEKAMVSIEKTFGEIEVETEIVSPVIGSHAGPKAIAIGYLGYDK